MEIDRLEEIQAELNGFKDSIETLSSYEDEFFQIMLNFRKFITTVKDDRICRGFLKSPQFVDYRIFFQKNNEAYMKGTERLEVQKILTGKIRNIEQDHIRYRYKEKHQEIGMFKLSKVKSIAVVGSGSFSETMLYCHQETSIDRIIGIDNSATVIQYAIKLAKFMHMERLEFVQQNAQEYNFREVDAIYITGFSYPKEEILKQIYETAKESVQILIDDCSQYLQRVIYDKFELDENKFNTLDINYLDTPYCYQKVMLLSMDK